MTPRSYLYVPGDSASKLARALDRGADALIVDLEDAVTPARKQLARDQVLAWLHQLRDPGTQIWIRVNAGARRQADVQALRSAPNLWGLCLAKTASADEVADIDRRLAGSPLALMTQLETATAVFEARAIAASPRVERLQLGEVDLSADLGIEAGPDGLELLWARAQVVAASAAAGIAPPVAAVSVDFRNLTALAESTLALRRLGFFGRACIHPAQLSVVHHVFTPTAAQIERARRIVALLDGQGVAVDEDGQMIDEAVLRSARRVLARSDARPKPQATAAD